MKQSRPFSFGVQYYRPPTPPPHEWTEDLKRISAAGFDAIKIWLTWRWHERSEGNFLWDDTDRLFDLSRKHNLKVVPNLILEAAPDWLYRQGDYCRRDFQGNTIQPTSLGCFYVGGWMPCFDHLDVRRAAGSFVKNAVRRYGRHPAFLLWDAWNEPRSRILGSPAGECTCPASRKSYRAWLERKFGTIKRLNSFYGKSWTDWSSVNPPNAFYDYAEMFLWRRWAMESVADRVGWVSDLIRSVDRGSQVMTHVGNCQLVQNIVADTSNDVLNAAKVDFYGSSLPFPENPWEVGLVNDGIRSITSHYWISEVYTRKPYWPKDQISAEDLKRWTWESIAHGAKGLFYWQYKAERLGDESFGYGLVDVDGRATASLEETVGIGDVLRSCPGVFSGLQPEPAKAALLYDERTDLISAIENRVFGAYRYKKALSGAYRLFWENDMPVDWLYFPDLSKLKQYAAFYLSLPLVIDKREAGLLSEYVQNGGILISEFPLGERRDNTWANAALPGAGLHNLFGCVVENRTSAEEKAEEVSFPELRMRFPVNGSERAELRLSGAEAIASWSNGAPAAAVRRFGRGRAVYLGFEPSLCARRECVSLLACLLGDVCPLTRRTPDVRVRRLSAGKKRVTFYFNHSDTPRIVRKTRHKKGKEIIGQSTFLQGNLRLPPRGIACILSGT